jgi:hypothetical protein
MHAGIDAGAGLTDDVVGEVVGKLVFDVGVGDDVDGDVGLGFVGTLLTAG